MTNLTKESLEKYRDLKITRKDLERTINQDLNKLKIEKAINVCSFHVIQLLVNYKNGQITKEELVEWVNTIWFSDLFTYCDEQSDCIASVMNELEEIDEDSTKISPSNIDKYINTLNKNVELKI